MGDFFVLLARFTKPYFCGMNIYDAIKEMQELSRRGESFSFSYMSYSYTLDKSHGPVNVPHAQLLPSSSTRNRYTDYMLRYRDMDTYEEKQCWQLLLLEFNGKELELV